MQMQSFLVVECRYAMGVWKFRSENTENTENTESTEITWVRIYSKCYYTLPSLP